MVASVAKGVNMSCTQYLLKESLLSEIYYFSESKKEDRQVQVVIYSVTYNHHRKHYFFTYNENGMVKHIRASKIKLLTIFSSGETQVESFKVDRKDMLEFIEELKIDASKSYLPSKNATIDFSTNWVKDKNIVLAGKLLDEDDKPISLEKKIFPIITMLGGKPKRIINATTDVLITFGDCRKNEKYKFAKEYLVPIADFIELSDLVQSELDKEMGEFVY